MKAITLIQPWATLIAQGHKRIETRSWPTRHRGPIAIHAGKTKIPNRVMQDLWAELGTYGVSWGPDPLPMGCVIAVARLTACVPTELVVDGHLGDIPPLELACGNYEPGRYAWLLQQVRPIEPVPARGTLGLWNWTPPNGAIL